MELTTRQKEILSQIVKYHIKTGEPVGSKQLAVLIPNSPSTATLRNEMNFLCEKGLLSQPHTSAGRAPTSQGYRYYVNQLMTEDDLDSATKEMIDNALDNAISQSVDLQKTASRLLSQITGLPSVSTTVTEDLTAVEKIEFERLSGNIYVMAVLLSDGRMRTKLCKVTGNAEQIKNGFLQIAKQHLERKKFLDLTPAYLQNVLACSPGAVFTLSGVWGVLTALINSIKTPSVRLCGESNIYSMLKEEQKAKQLLSFMERGEDVHSLLKGAKNPLSVVFGRETEHTELTSSALIVARFAVGSNEIGRIAVIGPTRMSYDRIIPSTKYLAKRLSVLMSENAMEEEI